MKMKELLLFLSCVLCVSAYGLHGDVHINGCSDFDAEDMYGLDGEEVAYADFNNHTEVYILPPFAEPMIYPGAYKQAVTELKVCRHNLKALRAVMKDYPSNNHAPSAVMMYTRDEVEFGEENTLICHVTGFYPAPVNVSWTKNRQKVTEGSSTNVPYPNKDGPFTQISRLQFTPQLGDIYSCTVQHLALTEPLTKIYSSGPADLCCTLQLVSSFICEQLSVFLHVRRVVIASVCKHQLVSNCFHLLHFFSSCELDLFLLSLFFLLFLNSPF
ncbi:H-2 class II histocompatibility antigen, A-U alpha chain-like isoform X1 [Oreochromis aureus]|uniref:H-2 class II histocompatibility antigen, A-U alpha chain-like isoform X1 n=1 Tax=Oreochromis aureus TaxID=47969 RepID=UPI00195363E3|nr:H-2 class II histocompatibility antigen, A-U alpha chain-like isoform X1 [Oreochromis aureus]